MKRLIITLVILIVISGVIWYVQIYVQPVIPEQMLLFITIFIVVAGIFANLIGSTDFFQKLWGKPDSSVNISSNQPRYREILVTRVWDAWIEGVLHRSLYNEIRMELGMELRSEAAKPWDTFWQMPERPPQIIPANKKILDVFSESGNSLVFIGEPGAGKTTELLELAGQAIERARSNPDQPAPIIFNLSSWTPKQTLDEWLVDEMDRRYRISPKIGKPWVECDDLMILLDGLDEVKSEHREQCVQAVNVFTARHIVPIAICCRKDEFQELATHLNMQGVVLIKPISSEKVVEYLDKADANLIGIYHKLNAVSDPETSQFIHTPLFFSILILAYRGASKKEIEKLLESDDYRRHLFDYYIEQMFQRRGKPHRWTRNQTVRWLGWLAKQMIENGQTVFYIENIQPSWLEERRQKKRFRILYTGSVAVIFGLIIGLTGGLIDGLVGGLGLIFGLISGLIFGLIGVRQKVYKPSYRLKWSWSVRRLNFGLTFAVIGGLIIVLSGASFLLTIILLIGLSFVLILGMSGVLSGMLSDGLITSEIEFHDQPGQSLQYSFRNLLFNMIVFGLMFGLISGLIIGLISGLMVGLMFGLMGGLIVGPIVGLVFWLIYGGSFVLSHILLRYILYQSNNIPFQLITFLDFASKRVLLRKVGGGYIFIHRLLMDHFAEMAK